MRLTAIQVGAGWFSENPDGPDRYYHDLLEVLPDAGVACRGLVVGTSQVEQETDGSVRTFSLPTDPLRKRWKNLSAAVARVVQGAPAGVPKVIVAHSAVHAYPLLKAYSGQPLVAHFHSCGAGESPVEQQGWLTNWRRRRAERAVYRRARRVIVLSEPCRTAVCRQFGVDESRVTVVPGGVDLDRFSGTVAKSRADARAPFGWPADRPTVLAAAKLVPGAGLELLVEAIGLVRRRVPRIACMVAGRGPLAETLVEQIEAAGLGDAITLLGFVPDEDLPLAYRAADVAVVPSTAFENYGLPAIEPLAAGTPVLVMPGSGLPELVRTLDPRLVVPQPTAAALADALVAVLADPGALPAADVCQAYAARHFDWRRVAERVAEVYAAAANGKQ